MQKRARVPTHTHTHTTSPREEIKNRNSEEYNVLKIQLEGIIEELEGHFEAVSQHDLRGWGCTARPGLEVGRRVSRCDRGWCL
jgi:hypothetical protein